MSDQNNTRKTYFVSVPSTDVSIMMRLSKTPTMRFVPSGQAVLDLEGAVTRRYQDKTTQEWKEVIAWYRASAWREEAERLNGRNLQKGDIVQIEYNPADLKATPYARTDGTLGASLDLSARRVHVIATSSEAPTETPAAAPVEEIPF